MCPWVGVTQMNFGLGRVEYSNLYLHSYQAYADEHGLADIDAAKGALDDLTIGVAGVTYVTSDATTTSGAGMVDADVAALTEAADAASHDPALTGNGTSFTATKSANGLTAGRMYKQINQLTVAASEGMLETTPDTNKLTAIIENVQGKINTARVQAGSHAALESAVNYTTDLTAQYELDTTR